MRSKPKEHVRRVRTRCGVKKKIVNKGVRKKPGTKSTKRELNDVFKKISKKFDDEKIYFHPERTFVGGKTSKGAKGIKKQFDKLEEFIKNNIPKK